jgi:hypothetical protein
MPSASRGPRVAVIVGIGNRRAAAGRTRNPHAGGHFGRCRGRTSCAPYEIRPPVSLNTGQFPPSPVVRPLLPSTDASLNALAPVLNRSV